MLKLKLQYLGHLMRRASSLEKSLILGKIEGRKRRGRQRMRWLDSITDSVDMNFEQTPGDSEERGSLVCCSPWGCKACAHKAQITSTCILNHHIGTVYSSSCPYSQPLCGRMDTRTSEFLSRKKGDLEKCFVNCLGNCPHPSTNR